MVLVLDWEAVLLDGSFESLGSKNSVDVLVRQIKLAGEVCLVIAGEFGVYFSIP
jgi:hypothetical protein